MIAIPLRITGETWYNAEDFRQGIEQLPDEPQTVIIDVNSEGPSLGLFGIYSLLANKYQHDYIFVRWSNPIEPGPYAKVRCSQVSHFFKLSKHYWIDEIPNTLAPRTFGLFVGRNSTARNYIMWDVYHRWGNKFLLSKMSTRSADIWEDNIPPESVKKDPFEDWADPGKQSTIRQWWATDPVSSIDQKAVIDQYDHPELSAAACIKSLLSYYTEFNFEIVCESYTRGTTFFPTEKTIRAIMGNKPFLVYGPRDYLKNLQDLGFKTFSGVWNERYDLYEGPARWEHMCNIIKMICSWDDATRTNVLTQCRYITRHNRNRLLELINDR